MLIRRAVCLLFLCELAEETAVIKAVRVVFAVQKQVACSSLHSQLDSTAARQRPVHWNLSALHCRCPIIHIDSLQMLDPLLDHELHREVEGPRQHSWQELAMRGPSLCVWTLRRYTITC